MKAIRKYGIYDTEETTHQVYSIFDEKGLSPTLDANGGGGHMPMIEEEKSNLKIRKLTPKECWRLMGFDDEDFDRAKEVNSDSQLYKQAGNSIVVNVLMAIFGQMVDHKDNREDGSNNIMPVLKGGVGEMKSNNGTQYYQQDRIYDSNSIALCQSANESFNPYYEVEEDDNKRINE